MMLHQQKQLGVKQLPNSTAGSGGGGSGTSTAITNQQQQLSVLLKQQELIRQQQHQATLSLGSQVTQLGANSPKKGAGGGGGAQGRKSLASLLAKKEDGQSPLRSKTQDQ